MSPPDDVAWAEARRRAAQWLAGSGAVPSAEDDWLDRWVEGMAAARAFAERYEKHDEKLSEADAGELVRRLHECLRDGVQFNPADTFGEAIKRALDPNRKDRVRYQNLLDARLDDHMRDKRSIPAELRVWFECRDKRPKHSRDSQNFTRDGWIVRTLRVLCDCGIKPTRNDATTRKAGCTIVAEVLGNMTETAVEKVWRERERVL